MSSNSGEHTGPGAKSEDFFSPFSLALPLISCVTHGKAPDLTAISFYLLPKTDQVDIRQLKALALLL